MAPAPCASGSDSLSWWIAAEHLLAEGLGPSEKRSPHAWLTLGIHRGLARGTCWRRVESSDASSAGIAAGLCFLGEGRGLSDRLVTTRSSVPSARPKLGTGGIVCAGTQKPLGLSSRSGSASPKWRLEQVETQPAAAFMDFVSRTSWLPTLPVARREAVACSPCTAACICMPARPEVPRESTVQRSAAFTLLRQSTEREPSAFRHLRKLDSFMFLGKCAAFFQELAMSSCSQMQRWLDHLPNMPRRMSRLLRQAVR